jgi:hypothetical protein
VETSGRQRNYEYTKIFLPEAEQADVYATLGASVLEKMLSGQDQLLLVYGQKETRTFTLQGTESSPSLVPQLYRNLFSSLEGRLQPIASHEPSGLHDTVPQCPNLYTGRFQLENKLNTLVSENDRFRREINADQRHGLFSAHI